MFEQIIALVDEKLGTNQNETKYDEELLKLELDALRAVRGSILELEIDPEADAVDVIRSSPNVLFFKDEEAPFLDAAIQSKKLIDQLVAINVPMQQSFGLEQMIMNGLNPNEAVTEDKKYSEEEAVDVDSEEVVEATTEAVEVETEEPTEDNNNSNIIQFSESQE